jgi:hypothetical protein
MDEFPSLAWRCSLDREMGVVIDSWLEFIHMRYICFVVASNYVITDMDDDDSHSNEFQREPSLYTIQWKLNNMLVGF